MARSRRASRPARVALAADLGSGIDGAWWPYSASVAAELPELVSALQRRLGEVVGIQINWSAAESQLDLETLAAGVRAMHEGERDLRPRLMLVNGQSACARMLVVPSMTSQTLGLMMLRTAARLPTAGADRDTRLFDLACAVMNLAEAECSKWSAAPGA
ncbi:MAG: DUF5994 family protein [Actinomycetota bacterium]|nr:DUF5994 family protein [Actinomycetota bacterium]